MHLAPEDRSWWPRIAAQLDLAPVERVRRLREPGGVDLADGLESLARLDLPAIVIGEVAGALHGWPLVLGGALELCTTPDAIDPLRRRLEVARGPLACREHVVVDMWPPGTVGFGDLARSAEVIEVGLGRLRVASLLDLIRIAHASPAPDARRRALAYQAVLDVNRVRRGPREPDDRSDREKIEAWLGGQTPVA